MRRRGAPARRSAAAPRAVRIPATCSAGGQSAVARRRSVGISSTCSPRLTESPWVLLAAGVLAAVDRHAELGFRLRVGSPSRGIGQRLLFDTAGVGGAWSAGAHAGRASAAPVLQPARRRPPMRARTPRSRRSGRRRPPRRGGPATDGHTAGDHSCRNASVGSSRAATRAGKRPDTRPTTTDVPSDSLEEDGEDRRPSRGLRYGVRDEAGGLRGQQDPEEYAERAADGAGQHGLGKEVRHHVRVGRAHRSPGCRSAGVRSLPIRA